MTTIQTVQLTPGQAKLYRRAKRIVSIVSNTITSVIVYAVTTAIAIMALHTSILAIAITNLLALMTAAMILNTPHMQVKRMSRLLRKETPNDVNAVLERCHASGTYMDSALYLIMYPAQLDNTIE